MPRAVAGDYAFRRLRENHDNFFLYRGPWRAICACPDEGAIIMKRKSILLIASAGMLHAGNTEPTVQVQVPAADSKWITPLLDIRARYEYAGVDGKDPSTALTLRERIGLKTKAWNGFSGLVEGEFTEVLGADYNSGAGPQAYPSDRANSVIADPRNAELNQAFLQYDGFDTVARVGRQRLIYDNAAFIGNSGWRQNEQTFDAISLSNKSIDGLTLKYAHLTQVNRIYGSEANSALTTAPLFDNVADVSANVNLFNASYTGINGLTLGGYAYLIDFEHKRNWDNNTFGVSAKGDVMDLTLYGEVAVQDRSGLAADGQAFYGHFTATKKIGDQTLVLGLEELGAGFKTPLATVHTFNGYADAFIGGRIEGNHHGLTDVYISHAFPICYGIQWTNSLHAYGDDEISTGYGWEVDSVLSKKFDDHFSSIVKFSLFESNGAAFVGSTGLPTTTRLSMELDYTF